jgi:hypothetical protein
MRVSRQRRIFARSTGATVLLWLVIACGEFSGELLANTTALSTNVLFLDERRLFALGMVESGNDDRGVGRLGEVSRYQIHPVVWKAYSRSRDYRNPEVALQVAHQHWSYLVNYFRAKSGREPTDFDMYVLWNTKFGYYARQGFNPTRIHPIVRDRAQRFVNLVNRRPAW